MPYNVNFKCSYMENDGDNSYRDDLLDVLGLEVYEEEKINERIDEIAKDVLEYEGLKPILSQSAARLLSDDPVIGLMLLFSYDSLQCTHNCLVDFYGTGEIQAKHLEGLMTTVSRK